MTSMKKINRSRVGIWFLTFSVVFSSIVPSLSYAKETKEAVSLEPTAKEVAPVELNSPQLETIRPLPEDIKPLPELTEEPVKEAPIEKLALPPEDEPVLPLEEGGEIPSDAYAKRDNSGNQPSEQAGQYSVDEFTGLFSYYFPIEIPQGRAGLQPDIALQYNHRQHNLGSMVGYGWSLNIPNISRENRTGVNNIYAENYFLLNGSQLVPINIDGSGYGTYGKLIEDDFSKIEYNSSGKWIVTDKLGTVYTYGATSASRQDNPGDSSQIFKWLLTEVRDTNDNYIKYEYYKDSGQIYPKKITYTGHGSTDGIFEVDFEPFASSAKSINNILSISYQTGFAVRTNYLLDSIDVKIDGDLASSYELDFSLNNKGNRYLLNSIIPKYYKDGQELVKDKTDFSYSHQDTTYQLNQDYTAPAILGADVNWIDSKRSMFIDINNDSYADYISIYCHGDTHNINVSILSNDGHGSWGSLSGYSVNIPFSDDCGGGLVAYSIPVSFAELNGDHMIDMVVTADSSIYYLNNGNGWTQEMRGLPVNLYQSSTPAPMSSVVFSDMNNDGYDDLIYDNHGEEIRVYIRNVGTGGWNLDNDYSIDLPSLPPDACFDFGGSPFAFIDINHDGLQDIFYKYDCTLGDTYTGEGVYLNNGSGLTQTTDFSPPFTVNDFSYTSYTMQKVRYSSDIDQDGLADRGEYRRSKWNYTYGQRSSGEMVLLGQTVFNTGPLETDQYFRNTMPVAIADINGDQVQDVIHSYYNGPVSYSEVYLGRGDKLDVLEKVNYQSGSIIHIYYDYSANEKDEFGNLKNPDLPFNMYVVKEIVVDDSLENWQGYKYQYSDGNTISYTDDNIKDVYGFAEVSKEMSTARPDIDLGDGSDGAFTSSGNATWTSDKNFTSLYIQAGDTVTIEPNVIIKVQGDAVIDGILTAEGKGYSGASPDDNGAEPGEGPGGGESGAQASLYIRPGGGGAGHSTMGVNGGYDGGGIGGPIYGFSNLEPIFMGSGGGAGSGGLGDAGAGGAGGGVIQLFANNIEINGEINADGQDGDNGINGGPNNWYYYGGGGAGSGGSIYLKAFNVIDIGNNLVHALGGQGGLGGAIGTNDGGDGGYGRIRIDAKIVIGVSNPNYYYNSRDVRYSIDYAYNNSNLQKVTNYYHTAKDDDIYLHGKIKESDKIDVQDNILSKKFITWQETDLGNDRKFVYDYEISDIDLSATTDKAIAFRNDYDSSNGNLNIKHDLGEVTINSSNGQIVSILSGDEKDTDYDYAVNTTKHILAAPKNKTISDTSDSKEQKLYYDELSYGDVDKVNLTKEEYETDEAEINRRFNNYGLVYEQSDPKFATTTLTYDDYNMYPATATDPLDNITQTEYNLQNSQIATSTAPNGLITVKEYDGFGRLIKTKISDTNNPAQLVVKQQINYYDEIKSSVASTDWFNPTETGDYFNDFSWPENGYVSDNQCTTAYTALRTQSYEGFNANVPLNVNITGIEVSVEHWTDTVPDITETVAYRIDSTGTWSDEMELNVLGTEHIDVVGGSNNLWGLVPTLDDFNTGNFSLYYRGRNSGQQTSSRYILDEIKFRVFYEDPSVLPAPRYAETKDYFDISNYVTSREYYDGLDRVIQKKAQTATNGEYSTVDISYDSQGRVERQSLPYITSTLEYTNPNLSQPAKSYTYDALDRVLSETTPVGTTSYDYDGFTTTITDGEGNQKELTKDAYGNLVQVKEFNNGDTYTTDYEYTLTNKLKKITDSQGNIRNFHYDDLDNLDWQDMVHRPYASDPEKIEYTHDKNGNVLTETSFKDDAISYQYDDLNRVLYEKLDGVNKIHYVYDENGDIGQLSLADYGDGNSKAYDYDILGRLTTATTTIENESFVMNYDYNLNGNLKEIEYPNGWLVTYSFNSVGQVEEVNLDKGSGPVTLADNIEYNQNGQMTHFERANGIDTDYIYDPAENFRLTNLLTSSSTGALQDIDYTYDNVGNITQIVDSSSTDLAKTVSYQYDDLNRLTTSTVVYDTHSGDDYTRTYDYDAIGNMIYNSALGVMKYDHDNPHQLSSHDSSGFNYDNAGNMKGDGVTSQYYWDWRNRLDFSNDLIASSTTKTYYEYDHNNQRFLKYTKKLVISNAKKIPEGGGFSWTMVSKDKYVDQYFQEDGSNDTKSHIYLNDIKLATVNNDTEPYYILGDHLNSSSILTDDVGNVAQLSDYQPYGKISYEDITTDLGDDYTFTGQEYDEEADIQYFGARYLDNQIGRFTAIEPVTLVLYSENKLKGLTGQKLEQILSDPQSLNSYTYSKNNPVILVDPDGNWWRELFTGQQSWSSFQVELGQAAQQLYNDSNIARSAMDHPAATVATVSIGGGLLAYGAAAGATALSVQYLGGAGTACLAGCDKVDDVVTEAPKLLNPGIDITSKALNKVSKVHQGVFDGTKSVFNKGEDIVGLVQRTTQHQMIPQVGDKFARMVDIGRNIGVDKLTGQQTSMITVITNRANELVTAYPGIPSYLSH